MLHGHAFIFLSMKDEVFVSEETPQAPPFHIFSLIARKSEASLSHCSGSVKIA